MSHDFTRILVIHSNILVNKTWIDLFRDVYIGMWWYICILIFAEKLVDFNRCNYSMSCQICSQFVFCPYFTHIYIEREILPIFVRITSLTLELLLVMKWGPSFNIKMSSYQYRKSHCEDKMVVWPFYLNNWISYTDKMTSLYWMRAQNIPGWL